MIPKNTSNPRTARTPVASEKQFILAAGAPNSYISGYGLCVAGAVVSLKDGADPGRWLIPISDEDAAKASADEAFAASLAAEAGKKVRVLKVPSMAEAVAKSVTGGNKAGK